MDILIIILLFILCTILMAVEIFILPGITLAGIAGAACWIAANYITFNFYGAVIGACVLVISLILSLFLILKMIHSKTFGKYYLHKTIDSTSATEAQLSVKPGDEGTTITRLTLIGNADIEGKTVEVKSADGFLDEGTPIVVVRVEDAQIFVKRK